MKNTGASGLNKDTPPLRCSPEDATASLKPHNITEPPPQSNLWTAPQGRRLQHSTRAAARRARPKR